MPEDFTAVREATIAAIAPIQPGNPRDYFYGNRSSAGSNLPPYYLVHFLFAELLRYPRLGRQEKVAWSIPISFEGDTYILEHRKMGMGLFTMDDGSEAQAERIVALVKRAVSVAKPYFQFLANEAIREGALNVQNRNASLYERFEFYFSRYAAKNAEAEENRGRRESIEREHEGRKWTEISFPEYVLRKEAGWYAIGAIDAFFSWTEHLFVHLFLLKSSGATGDQVAELADADWQKKFKAALDVSQPDNKRHMDALLPIRRQLRNFLAHGAFGKEGEAFTFHSRVGAVPVSLGFEGGRIKYSLGGPPGFDEAAALKIVQEFIAFLSSSSDSAPAFTYTQNSGLPTILTMVNDGTYLAATKSTDGVESLVDSLQRQSDIAADMDW